MSPSQQLKNNRAQKYWQSDLIYWALENNDKGLEIATNTVARVCNSFSVATKKFMLVLKLRQVHFVNGRPDFSPDPSVKICN